jgi:hypothetical protein
LGSRRREGHGNQVAPNLAELDAYWADLSKDAAKGYSAIWALIRSPDVSTTFLKERLKPVVPAPAAQTSALIADLDSSGFAVRDKAAKTLENLGPAAEDAIRKALQAKPSLESRHRLEAIIESIDKRDGYIIQKLRASAALEYIGTPQAKEVLQSMTTAPNPRVADTAAMSLNRLVRVHRAAG